MWNTNLGKYPTWNDDSVIIQQWIMNGMTPISIQETISRNIDKIVESPDFETFSDIAKMP